ncbi:MAG: hypothetical protein DRJ31_02485 [Candidatus Methanomethylicota archaeon]|uniref:Uncharacterized protein n=1 Tax=Thermoproteota archaeon TaxID=2056631 RepID=A0A497ERW2_9CREN|nr:MAG: hypothetical protein DRJ31_02485 [Candidatus Verstraetearchaeota archaeon]
MSTTTITVSRETKELLESLRGNMTWDEFLKKLALELKREKARRAIESLRSTAFKRDISEDESRLRLGLH